MHYFILEQGRNIKLMSFLNAAICKTIRYTGVLCGTLSTRREPSMADKSGREPKIKKQYRYYISKYK
jgi:hypothetical protein